MQKVEGSNPFSRFFFPFQSQKRRGGSYPFQDLALQLESAVPALKVRGTDQEQPIKQAQTGERSWPIDPQFSPPYSMVGLVTAHCSKSHPTDTAAYQRTDHRDAEEQMQHRAQGERGASFNEDPDSSGKMLPESVCDAFAGSATYQPHFLGRSAGVGQFGSPPVSYGRVVLGSYSMSATKVKPNSNSPELHADAVVNGLRQLARRGQVTPQAILAIPELVQLPMKTGSTKQEAEAAIQMANAVRSAIDATSMPAAAHVLFGLEDHEVRRPLGERRESAAKLTDVTPGSFRVRREARLLEELARALLIELAATAASSPSKAEMPSGGAHFEIERGPVRATIPVSAARSPILIGRDPNCDIELRDDPMVSRRHARLTLVKDEWILEDLGSANGTEAESGTVTTPLRLQDGEVITIGRTRLTFRIDQDDPVATVIGRTAAS